MLDDRPVMLVVGAAEGSLGEAIVTEARADWEFSSVVTAGISREEFKLDVTYSARVAEVLAEVQPDVVVCTVGVNSPADIGDAFLPTKLMDSFTTNVAGPMEVLRHFLISPVRNERIGLIKKFVAISSNSARIPRTRSLPYCASKAALSMALRVAARELAPQGQCMVWGYEPGLLAGTPMTQQTRADFNGNDEWVGQALHRMKGVPAQGISVNDLAHRVVSDVANFSVAHNGLIIPFDAGEI